MQPTDTRDPTYFHKVVDCQWACPAHTPVPEYIRLIAQGRYGDAYMVNWVSNVFPGILGRTCDRPCEPACRRGRVEEENLAKPEPVAICRLKRVAADHKEDIRARMPTAAPRNGKRVACVGAGPASLTVARDLAPLGYHVTVFDSEAKAGGFMWSQIPRFRLPESVIDEETGYITDMPHVDFWSANRRIDSLKQLLAEDFDAVFVGCGAPRGRDLDIPGRKEAADSIHIGIDWLASVSFGHVTSGQAARHRARRRQHRDGLLPLGAAPGRQRRQGHRAQRLRGDEGLAVGEGRCHARRHPDHQLPRAQGLRARGRQAGRHELRDRRAGVRRQGPAQPQAHRRARGLLRLRRGADRGRPGERLPVDRARRRHRVRRLGPAGARMPSTFQSTRREVFFGGDAAFGPKNIITAVAHGHEAAVSIDLLPARRGRGPSGRRR